MLTFIKHYTLRLRWFIVLFLLLFLALLLFFRPENKAMPRPRVISPKGLYKFSYQIEGGLYGGGKGPYGVAISPHNQLLTTIRQLRLLDISNQKELWIHKTPHTDITTRFAFSPDGQLFATAAYHQLEIHTATNGSLVQKLPSHDIFTTAIAFSPDGQFLASGGEYDELVKLWRVSNGELVYTITQHTNGVNSVVFSPDGQWLLSGSDDNTIGIWQTSDGALVHRIKLPTANLFVKDIVISSDGQYLAVANWSTLLWVYDLTSMTLYKAFDTRDDKDNGTETVAFLPNSSILAAAGFDGLIQFWDVPNGKLLQTLTGHRQEMINDIAISADGQYLASVGDDNSLTVWVAIEP